MFAIHAKNSETGKVFHYRSRITGKTTTFYAERGIIRVHDEATGEYKPVSLADFHARTEAIYAGILRSEPSDERADQKRLAQTMVLAIEAAREQGNPLSRRALGEMAGQRRNGRIINPGAAWELGPVPQAPADKPFVPLDATAPQAYVPAPVARSTAVAKSTNILGL